MTNSAYRKKCVEAFFLGLFVSANATASEIFELLDRNADGVLSGNEAKMFMSFDTEPVEKPDGEVTKKEFNVGLRLHEKKRVEQVLAIYAARNGNHDDRLSGTEMSGYEFADLDGDGRIPSKEFLAGMAKQRNKLGALSLDELSAEGMRRFRLLDNNEDSKLSGSEAVGLLMFDQNDDNRISLDEFMSSIFMDAACASQAPPMPADNTTGDAMRSVVDSVNRRDGKKLLGMFRPELREIVDAPLIDYLMYHINVSHGQLSRPANDAVQVKDAGKEGQKRHSAIPACEKGTLSIEMTMFEDAILGIVFESPEVDGLNDKMFADLIVNKEEWLDKFAHFYEIDCVAMIKKIMESKDSDAFAMFHPEVQSKIGLESFLEVFKGLRMGCGSPDSMKIELEEAGVEPGEKGRPRFFTITHRVAGPDGVLMFKLKMQFVGLQGYFVSAGFDPAKAVDGPQATKQFLSTAAVQLIPLSKPVPAIVTNEDLPLAPPATGKSKP